MSWWANLKHEWATMPWTPRARRIGTAIELVAGVTILVFGGVIVEGIVQWLLS